MATPSIVQQRVVLVVFLAIIGAVVWWQNAGDRPEYTVQKFSKPPIADAVDFSSAEAAWSDLRIDSQGNLQIDALTESALLDAIALMSDQPSDGRSARIAFLLEKQFGATASKQIMELLPALKNYKEAEQRWWTENGNRNPPPHAELFELQDELLGETLAKQLFSEQRRLVSVMLASQQIREDAALTPAEKEQALMRLQESVRDEEGARVE